MARCFRCDRCGKIMIEIPFGEENARKTLEVKVITTYNDIINTRRIEHDLCSDCCFGLESAIVKYMHMEEKK